MDLQVLGCGPPLSQGLWLPGHEDKGNRANSTGEDDGNDSWDQLQRGRSTLILVNQGQHSLGGEKLGISRVGIYHFTAYGTGFAWRGIPGIQVLAGQVLVGGERKLNP